MIGQLGNLKLKFVSNVTSLRETQHVCGGSVPGQKTWYLSGAHHPAGRESRGPGQLRPLLTGCGPLTGEHQHSILRVVLAYLLLEVDQCSHFSETIKELLTCF